MVMTVDAGRMCRQHAVTVHTNVCCSTPQSFQALWLRQLVTICLSVNAPWMHLDACCCLLCSVYTETSTSLGASWLPARATDVASLSPHRC